MLLAVMFLLVGVPNAPVLSANVGHLHPSLELTFNGTASTETMRVDISRRSLEHTSNGNARTEALRSKSTSKDIFPSPTLRSGTMLTNPLLESTAVSDTQGSTAQHLSQTISSTTLVSISTNYIDRKTASDTAGSTTPGGVFFATVRSTPATIRRTITTKSLLKTTSSPITITRTPPSASTAKETTVDQRFIKESSKQIHLAIPKTSPLEGTYVANDGSLNSASEVSRTQVPNRTTFPDSARRSGARTERLTTSIIESQTPQTVSESPPTLKLITLRKEVSNVTDRMQPLSSEMKSKFIPTITTIGPQSKSSTSFKTRQLITRKSILALPKLSVSTDPHYFQNEKYIDKLQNAVEPTRHSLNSQETRSASFEDEFGNSFHPTLPSLFPRKATKVLKTGCSDEAKPATTPSPVALQKPKAPNPDYYQYRTSSTLSALNLLGNKKFLQTTSAPMTWDSTSVSPVPSFPVKPQSVLRPIFSSRSASLYPKIPYVGPLPTLTRDRSQSMRRPIYTSGRSSPDSQQLPHVVPLPALQTKDGNQSVLRPVFTNEGSSPDNRKLPHVVQVPPGQHKDKNHSVLHSEFPPNVQLPQVAPPFRLTNTNSLPPDILPRVTEMDNVMVNSTQNCSNDYCVSDEDYIDMMLEYMFPTHYEWVLIGMHTLVFIGGLVGNALVCLAVYRNISMRTVTNYFIVNLAVADFLVILLCLPPTVLWDVTETWFMGTALCKIVLYFQTVSVAVSVLTLTFISIDRWYAICWPLKFKSTTGRAKKAILAIWVLALAFDIPEMVVLKTKPKELNIDTMFFTQCEASWSDTTDMVFHCLQTILLYTVPLVFMTIAYYQIVKVLWSSDNIPGHKERLNSSGSNTQSTSCRSGTIARKKTIKRTISNSVSTTGQVIRRRKAAKMLVAVVVMFAVCYFPVHLLSILRYIYDIPQTDATTAFSMVSHWLCYANSAVNPLIYNFMSGKFRKEFANTFGCRRFSWKRPTGLMRRRRRRQEVASLGDRAVQPTEMAPLSHNGAANIVVDIDNRC